MTNFSLGKYCFEILDEICENFKKTFFTEQFQTAASELKTLPPGNREEIERT